jgi:hypothetical protein
MADADVTPSRLLLSTAWSMLVTAFGSLAKARNALDLAISERRVRLTLEIAGYGEERIHPADFERYLWLAADGAIERGTAWSTAERLPPPLLSHFLFNDVSAAWWIEGADALCGSAAPEVRPEQVPQGPATKLRRRGPSKGSVSRYAAADRKFFPRMRKLIAKGETVAAAALACGNHLKGGGTLESRATRLAKLFRRENPTKPGNSL